MTGQVSDDEGHVKLGSMASLKGSRSLQEGPMRNFIGDLPQHGLLLWVPSAQGEEPDESEIQIDDGAHEPVDPVALHLEGSPQKADASLLGAAAKEYDLPRELSLQVQFPVRRESRTVRSRLDSHLEALAIGRHIPGRALLNRLERLVVESSPDLELPAPIVGLDGSLEAGLPRGREDGHDSQLQTQSGNSADHVGPVVRALESGVVVELRIRRQAHFVPVRDQRV